MRGGQWQVLYLLRGLAAQGHSAPLLARAGSALLDRARTVDLDARPLRLRSLVRIARFLELVHAHDARPHTLASVVSSPLVVSRRVAFPLHRSILSRWKYSKPARYIAVSKYVKQILVEAGISDDRISVVYDGVPLPPEPRYGNRTHVIAMDSGDPGKGKALILEAARSEAARSAKINVIFSKNLAADLERAAIFVYITGMEGLGSAGLLAVASGVPVLALRVGGLPESVEDSATGLLTVQNHEQHPSIYLVLVRDTAMMARLRANGPVG